MMTLENYLMYKVEWFEVFNEEAPNELSFDYDYETEERLKQEIMQHEY
jgi:hypothetical protein